jgi:tetratricopeptide (TPR) repeat protein
MRSLLFKGAICVCLVLSACSESKETRLQRYLIQGNEKLVLQEYEQAERFYGEALRLDTCYTDALNNLGTVYHRRKDNAKAVEFYSKALACNPGFTEGYFNRANAYYELNKATLSLADLESVARVKPDTIVLHQLRALNFWKLHRYNDAIISFRKMMDGSAADADIMVNIGTVFTLNKQFDSARHYLSKAIAMKPGEANAFNAIGLVEAETGNIAKAHEWIDQALKSRPRDPYFLNNKGYLFLLEKRNEDALPLINESIGIDPYNGWAYRNKGIYYLQKQNADEAIRLLQRAEEIDPLMDKLYFWLGEAYGLKKDAKMSCGYFEKAFSAGQLSADELKEKCN